jgi:hypothetical protein
VEDLSSSRASGAQNRVEVSAGDVPWFPSFGAFPHFFGQTLDGFDEAVAVGWPT